MYPLIFLVLEHTVKNNAAKKIKTITLKVFLCKKIINNKIKRKVIKTALLNKNIEHNSSNTSRIKYNDFTGFFFSSDITPKKKQNNKT